MEGRLLIIMGAIFVFILGIAAYFFLMFFYPEWVGITGKTALDAQKAHRGGDAEESDFWKKLDADIETPKDTKKN